MKLNAGGSGQFSKISTIHKSDLTFAGHYIQSTKMMLENEKLKCAWEYKWKITTNEGKYVLVARGKQIYRQMLIIH